MLISVNTFWTILLIVHGLLAIALLGALTHQAMAVLMPVRQAAGYATAICVLWILTFLMGAWIYTKYRIYVRIPIEQAGYWKTQGFFELKEHAATLGLGLLPIYWYIWKNVHDPEYDGVRKSVTALLAFICWFNFLVGHVLNNVRGFGS
jgi:protein-S-isoprenylcysteine O-methyltransferase Ste14